MPINLLPLKVTIDQVKMMYVNFSSEQIELFLVDIQQQLKNERTKNDTDLSILEWLSFIKQIGIPIGYARIFEDCELLEDKLKNYPELDKII